MSGDANTAQFIQPLLGRIGPAPIMSEKIDQIAAALAEAQGRFEAVDKSAANPFFKSSYAPLPDVVKAAAPILSDLGLSVWQGPDHDPTDRSPAGDLLWTVVLHKSGQYIGSAMRMRPVKADPQAQGSAITYGRRYAYMAALGLVADEDDDGNTASGRGNASKPHQQSRQPSATKSPSKPAEPVSKAPSAPSDTSDPDDDSGPVTEETITQIKAAYKESKVTETRLRDLMREAGATVKSGPIGKSVSALTQDQGSLVLLTLRRIGQANNGTIGDDD